MTLPDHLMRLTAPLQVWEYIEHLQRKIDDLNARLEQVERERDTAVATSNLACQTRDQQRKRADDLLVRLHEAEQERDEWKREA